MGEFSTLPFELRRMIIVEAVKSRSLKRAFRLRHVSRLWSSVVMEAIFECDMLYGLRADQSLIWPHYLTYRITQKSLPLSRPLRIVLRVAKHIVARRGDGIYNDDGLKQCVLEICQTSVRCNCDSEITRPMTDIPELCLNGAETEDENHDVFRQALLASAVTLNDLGLVRQFLVERDCRTLICQSHSNPYW